MWVSNSVLLSNIHRGSLSGCPWCELLSDGTHFFEHRWSHLTDLEKSKVHLLIERAPTNSRTHLYLRWPSKRPPDPLTEYFEGDSTDYDRVEIEFVFEQASPLVVHNSVPKWAAF
jgi:hypothetical protein